MAKRKDGSLVSWWRYFLIFMGVSFNKVKAVHELSSADEAALEEKRQRLRALAEDAGVRAMLLAVQAQPPGHVNQEVWRRLRPQDPFVAGLRRPEFLGAVKRVFGAEINGIYLSAPAGEKVAFTDKPRLFNHFDQNAHRFPMAGEEYTEVHLKVAFDPDSEVKAIEIGVPVRSEAGAVLGSLVALVDYQSLKERAGARLPALAV